MDNIIEQALASAHTLVDVRSFEEFKSGSVVGAINIPVGEVEAQVEDIKALQSPIILCCASGARSAMAQQLLQKQGIECYNAGSWMHLNYLLAKKMNT